jgi:hypothetical protein
VEETLRLGAGALLRQELHDLSELRAMMAAQTATVRAGFERYLGRLGG